MVDHDIKKLLALPQSFFLYKEAAGPNSQCVQVRVLCCRFPAPGALAKTPCSSLRFGVGFPADWQRLGSKKGSFRLSLGFRV